MKTVLLLLILLCSCKRVDDTPLRKYAFNDASGKELRFYKTMSVEKAISLIEKEQGYMPRLQVPHESLRASPHRPFLTRSIMITSLEHKLDLIFNPYDQAVYVSHHVESNFQKTSDRENYVSRITDMEKYRKVLREVLKGTNHDLDQVEIKDELVP